MGEGGQLSWVQVRLGAEIEEIGRSTMRPTFWGPLPGGEEAEGTSMLYARSRGPVLRCLAHKSRPVSPCRSDFWLAMFFSHSLPLTLYACVETGRHTQGSADDGAESGSRP